MYFVNITCFYQLSWLRVDYLIIDLKVLCWNSKNTYVLKEIITKLKRFTKVKHLPKEFFIYFRNNKIINSFTQLK